MTSQVVFHVFSTPEPITVMLDRKNALEIPAVETKESQEFVAQIKQSFISLANVYIELIAKSSSYKKLHDLSKGHQFYVTVKEDKTFDVQQTKVVKTVAPAEQVDKDDLSRFQKKPQSSPVVKKWATVETGKKKDVDRSKIVNSSANTQVKEEPEPIVSSEDNVKIFFYFGHFHYDESGETEPCNILINAVKMFSDTNANGKIVELEVVPPKVAFDHKISLLIEGPQGTFYDGRLNLTENGCHFLVSRMKHAERLKVEQSETGDAFKLIADEEAAKQAPAAQE